MSSRRARRDVVEDDRLVGGGGDGLVVARACPRRFGLDVVRRDDEHRVDAELGRLLGHPHRVARCRSSPLPAIDRRPLRPLRARPARRRAGAPRRSSVAASPVEPHATTPSDPCSQTWRCSGDERLLVDAAVRVERRDDRGEDRAQGHDWTVRAAGWRRALPERVAARHAPARLPGGRRRLALGLVEQRVALGLRRLAGLGGLHGLGGPAAAGVTGSASGSPGGGAAAGSAAAGGAAAAGAGGASALWGAFTGRPCLSYSTAGPPCCWPLALALVEVLLDLVQLLLRLLGHLLGLVHESHGRSIPESLSRRTRARRARARPASAAALDACEVLARLGEHLRSGRRRPRAPRSPRRPSRGPRGWPRARARARPSAPRAARAPRRPRSSSR